MNAKFKSLPELFDYFNTEEKCFEYLVNQRWPKGICCPYCGKDKVYNTKRKKTNGVVVQAFKCANSKCYKKFTPVTGTYMEGTKIELRLWIAAFYLITSHKKSLSSVQLGKFLNTSQKTGWFISQRIRSALSIEAPDKLGGVVEMDEVYIGSNKNDKGTGVRGRSQSDKKTAVVGMVERGGRVVARSSNNLSRNTMNKLAKDNVEQGSIVFTDELKSYNELSLNYFHETIKHNQKEYARGMVHTNTIEGFWSQLKRQIFGTHHWVSKKHLDRYVIECGYKWNTRLLSDPDRFSLSLTHTHGRLKYQVLTRAIKA